MDLWEYVDFVEYAEYDITGYESKEVMNEYGSSALHVFQAIALPFLPIDQEDSKLILFWKILCCIAYFHYDRIPRFALEQSCHILREGKEKKYRLENKIDTGNLILKLSDYNICLKKDKNYITFHEIVLNAFRLTPYSTLTYEFKPLNEAIKIMSILVSKDMRKKEHSTKMYKLRRHVQTLLAHVEQKKQILEFSEDAILLKALISHLHETAGAIMLNESNLFLEEANQHFESALSHIWPEVGKDLQVEFLRKDRDREKLVNKILKLSKSKASNLPDDFTVKYTSKLDVSFEEEELEFLKSKCVSKIGFTDVEKSIKEKRSSETIVRKLLECGLLIPEEKYRNIFYAERFAFILHSWSRLVLYGDSEQVKELGEWCNNLSNLSNRVSVKCNELYGVSLLAEHLSKFGGLIPISLKLKKSKNELKKSLQICKKALCSPKGNDMYENAMLKEVNGPSHNMTRISLLRYIVRINARLHEGASPEDVKKADKMCEDLLKLSEKHVETISACIMCFIYCAKYYAAKGEFNEAMKCFDKYFIMESERNPRFNTRCWAIYNYAKAVQAQQRHQSGKKVGEKCPSLFDHKQQAAKRCHEVLESKDVMNKTLQTEIKKLKVHFQSI